MVFVWFCPSLFARLPKLAQHSENNAAAANSLITSRKGPQTDWTRAASARLMCFI